MNYLTMGAVFRNENSWLEEWVRYHHALVVEHFVLYNDDIDTHVSDRILKPYIDQGFVENIHVRKCPHLIRKDGRLHQDNAYREMIGNVIGTTQWLAIVDLDELILPRQCDDIRKTLEEFEEHNGLAINWSMFGTSGYIKRPPTQINHLLHRSETNWASNHYVKSIVKPDRVLLEAQRFTHFLPTRDGVTVNENHEPVTGMRHGNSMEKIRINHYVVRSWQDFWEVKTRRPRLGPVPPCDAAYFEQHDRNEVFDDEISRRFGKTIQNLR
jgi:hypothetical protein